MSDMMVYSLVGFVVLFILFLILRELFCWYWKINKMCDLLETQNKYLLGLCKKQGITINEDIDTTMQDLKGNNVLNKTNTIGDFSTDVSEDGKLECPNCGKEISITDKKCPYCNKKNEAYGTQV